MEMNLRTPTARQQRNYSGDTKLVYAQECLVQPLDFTQENYGDLLLLIDEDGLVLFEYYQWENSISREDPPEETTTMYYKECGNVEVAKQFAEIVLLDIEHSTEERWKAFGFKMEVV